MTMGPFYSGPGESGGLYGTSSYSAVTYFEWFIYYVGPTQPATPTGGSWNFLTSTGTPPAGWIDSPPPNPTDIVWISTSIVSSRSTSALTWSIPGRFSSFSGNLPSIAGHAGGILTVDPTASFVQWSNNVQAGTF